MMQKIICVVHKSTLDIHLSMWPDLSLLSSCRVFFAMLFRALSHAKSLLRAFQYPLSLIEWDRLILNVFVCIFVRVRGLATVKIDV